MRKLVYLVVLIVVLSLLFMNRASAVQILVFAPSNWAGNPPSYPTAFYWGMGYATLGSSGSLDTRTGGTIIRAVPFNTSTGYATTWFDTGWYTFKNTTQTGSVHGDTCFWYRITGSAEVRVYLRHYEWPTCKVWMEEWRDTIPNNGISKAVDLGIYPNKLDTSGTVHFEWTQNYKYHTVVLIHARARYVVGVGSEAIVEGKYDDILWITYGGSPGVHWVQSTNEPEIKLTPPIGPVGTKVAVNGSGFAPESWVYLYYDGEVVNKTLSDGYGSFASTFLVPPSEKGPHILRAIDQLENSGISFFDVFIDGDIIAGDITGSTPGVPDGTVDMRDIGLVARNFGKTDPNVDPPETTKATDVSTNIPALASIPAVSMGLFGLRKKKRQH